MPRTKKEYVCVCKPTPVLTDNDYSDSDTVENLVTSEQPESEHVLFQETVEKEKRHAKNAMPADTEEGMHY